VPSSLLMPRRSSRRTITQRILLFLSPRSCILSERLFFFSLNLVHWRDHMDGSFLPEKTGRESEVAPFSPP